MAPIKVGWILSAPKPCPKAMAIKKYPSSSGSFIAVLNRMMESAPTRPRESAREDLTILIIIKVVTPTTTRTFDNWDLFDRDLPNLT
jgi:hypothetical protein